MPVPPVALAVKTPLAFLLLVALGAVIAVRRRIPHAVECLAAAGAVILVDSRPTAIMGFVVRAGRVAAIDVLADPARIARIAARAASETWRSHPSSAPSPYRSPIS